MEILREIEKLTNNKFVITNKLIVIIENILSTGFSEKIPTTAWVFGYHLCLNQREIRIPENYIEFIRPKIIG